MSGKILVVDDEHLILTAVGRSLSRTGYQVFCASDREALCAVLAEGPFDLLITDMHLMEDTAEEIIDRVCAGSPEAKVLVMSGSNNSGNAPNFIEKPFSIEGLRKKVKDILDGPG